ncbi:peptidoglycan-binding protein [Streptomyces sp. AcH 505]|uniref:peptidoglycan-binding protein n=1 Tax=Streptomyces sp. AcH 505 TaxID=352211 RepID=UPI0005A78EFA
MKRLSSRKQLGALIGTVVLVGAGGWFAGTQVRSPADAAAAHTAPEAGPVTVAVQRQSLTATVVATGSVEFASPEPLSLAGPVGTESSGSAEDKGAEQRVTKAPAAGTKIKEGDVLMTVNGRPVFALSGSVPMYRALGPGSAGDDVKELQKALRRLGFDPGGSTGTYGQGTASAITAWYTSKGYEAQQPGADEQQQLGQLQQEVSSAQQALLSAKAITQSDVKGGTDDAGEGEAGAPEAKPGAEPKPGTHTDTDAGSGAGSGNGNGAGTGTGTGTGTDKEIQEIQLKSAQKALDMANAALSTFQSSYGTKLPAGEVIVFPKLPVRLDKVTVRTGAVATGQIGTVTSSDMVVQAVVPSSDAQLLHEGMAVEVAAAGGGKTAAGVVEAIGADAAPLSSPGAAESDGTAPAGAEAGTADGPGGTNSSGRGTSGSAATGSDSTGSDPSAPVQLRVSLPDPGPLTGQSEAAVKVTIKVGASKGNVLTVPLAAVRTSADGKARVQIQRAGGVSDVDVTVGLSAGGLVEVKPAGGTLAQGDRVVVGE